MFGRNKDRRWYVTARKLYVKERLDAPYAMLFRYYTEIGPHGTGHRDFFSMLKFDDIKIEKALDDLREILPRHLSDNCLAAYEAYNALGEEPEADTIIETMEKYDLYAADNADETAEILRNYVTNLMKY